MASQDAKFEGAVPLQLSRFDQTRHIGRRPVTLSAIGQVVRWRWRLILGVVVLMVVAGATASLLLTPRYASTAKVRITPTGALPSVSDDTRDQPLDQALLNTEVTTIRSRDIARRVVAEFGLQGDPEFVPASQRAGTSPAERARATETAISSLIRRLNVEQQEKSYVIAIGFQSTSPAKAARVANAVAAAYINNTADVLMSTAARQAASGQAALERLSRQAEIASANVAEYRTQAGIVQGGNGSTINDQQIAPLAMQLATAEAQAAAARSNVEAAQRQIATGGADAVSAVLSSGVIADLRRQRTEAERQRAQLTARYGPKFPALQESEQQIRALEAQIRQEQSRIIEGLKSEARAAEAQAASLRGQLGVLKAEIARNNSAAVKAESLQRNADAATSAYNRLAGSVQQTAQVQRSNEPQARLLEAAVTTAKPTFPNRPAILFASLLGGMVLGVAVALLSEGMQATLRSADDVEVLLGIRYLAAVPQMPRKQAVDEEGQKCSPADTLCFKPMSAYSEAFRVLRNALRFEKMDSAKVDSLAHRQGHGALVVAMSSTLPMEGKTTCSLSLARVMAMSGERVLLVDCDIRRAGLIRLIDRKVEAGTLEVLEGKATIDEALVPDKVDGLTLMPVRKPTFTPHDVFGSDATARMIEQVRDRFDYVIFDTPPTLGVTDARTLARLSDGVVMLVKWGQTPLAAVDAALAGFEQEGARIIGAALTMVDPQSEVMGALYYSRRYTEYYQS